MQSNNKSELQIPNNQVKKPEFISDINFQRMCFAYWIIHYRLNDDTNTWEDLEKFETKVGLKNYSHTDFDKIMKEYENISLYVNNFVGTMLYQREGNVIQYEENIHPISFVNIQNIKMEVEPATATVECASVEIVANLSDPTEPNKPVRKSRAKKEVVEESEAVPRPKPVRKSRAKKEDTAPSTTPPVVSDELIEEIPVDINPKPAGKPRAKKTVPSLVSEDVAEVSGDTLAMIEKKPARKPRAVKGSV
jgi:hypothetical protein